MCRKWRRLGHGRCLSHVAVFHHASSFQLGFQSSLQAQTSTSFKLGFPDIKWELLKTSQAAPSSSPSSSTQTASPNTSPSSVGAPSSRPNRATPFYTNTKLCESLRASRRVFMSLLPRLHPRLRVSEEMMSMRNLKSHISSIERLHLRSHCPNSRKSI